MGVGRKCRRQFGCKKVLIVATLSLAVMYLASVLVRVPKSREILDVASIQNFSSGPGFCGVKCYYDQVSFYIKTGFENKEGPTVCFQNNVLLSQKKENIHRGLNVAVINDKTLQVVETRYFDTYIYDDDFKEYVEHDIEEGHIVMIASFDEIAVSLSEGSRYWLKVLGSEEADSLNFRDSYMLIGQKGLQQGHAIEYRTLRGDQRYSEVIEKTGCFALPLGPVYPLKVIQSMIAASSLRHGDKLENCGLPKPCGDKSFPVMVYTGKGSDDYPKICVNEYLVMKKDLNNAGRGMNVVIVNQHTVKVKHAMHFDTYDKDSSELETFLDDLEHGDIVIIVSFDDASRKLSFETKEYLNRLGSSMVQNLKFRDVWYFVSQKGIKGFTNLEKISYVAMDADWPEPIQDAFCVPNIIKGSEVIPDPPVSRNDARRDFCKKYDGYGEFCDATYVDNPPIKPVGLVDEILETNPVFDAPIIIVPGLNHNALVKTMETTVMQPGVKLKNVIVAWDEKFPEHADLAGLFGFINTSLTSSKSYPEQMIKAIEKVCPTFKHSKYFIVLEEELILAPDFLYFLAQLPPVLENDDSLLGVSAFNYHGYKLTSSKHSTVYRVGEFPGLGFLMKMSVFWNGLKGNAKIFGKKRAWDGWRIPFLNMSVSEMLVPDVSRVFRQPYEGSNKDEDYLVELFNTHRVTNLEIDVKLTDLDKLTAEKYEKLLAMQLEQAKPARNSDIDRCFKGDLPKIQIEGPEKFWAIFYKQEGEKDYSLLVKLCQCFGIPVPGNQVPKNLHHGLLQFSYGEKQIFLVGSSTKYFQHKSESVPVYS